MLIISILLVAAVLIFLLIIHELGHFVAAKKMGVIVEEFGLGYPPRIFGKKIKGTLYSLNLLPFGAFVRMLGEEKEIKKKGSFSSKPVWQRAVIVFGGVASFWLTAFLIFTLVASIWGMPRAVSDSFPGRAFVQVVHVAPNSPASRAGIEPGDIILGLDKIDDIQYFIKLYKGNEVVIKLKRGKKILEKHVVPRSLPPEGQGPLGVGLVRVSKIKSPWPEALWVGLKATTQRTFFIIDSLKSLLSRKRTVGLQVVGPIGVGAMMSQALGAGIDNFLLFTAMIAIWLAIFNLLPIPALDGGRLLFLGIEALRRKPLPRRWEERANGFFFLLLVVLMAFVTIKDIVKLF